MSPVGKIYRIREHDQVKIYLMDATLSDHDTYYETGSEIHVISNGPSDFMVSMTKKFRASCCLT